MKGSFNIYMNHTFLPDSMEMDPEDKLGQMPSWWLTVTV